MKNTYFLLILTILLVSCSSNDNQETSNNTQPPNTPVVFNKLKAYKNNIYYENITNSDWHKIKQNLDTVKNTITQDSAQFSGPNIIKTYKVISSSYYENYNKKNVNYMIYSISEDNFKYIMFSHATNVNTVVIKKFKKESDIEFTEISSQDGEYYLPIKNK